MIGSPSNLELLLHCYYSLEPHPRYDAPAIVEGTEFLLRNEMIEERSFEPRTMQTTYIATDKGVAYIKHLMQTPFPIAHWIIPQKEPV